MLGLSENVLKNLHTFKKSRSESEWLIPMTLKTFDDRDYRIVQRKIFGVKKHMIPDRGFDFSKPEISPNLAKILFLKAADAYDKLTVGHITHPWTVFDNLDKDYTMRMIWFFESKLDSKSQPFQKEFTQFIKIDQTVLTKDEIADNWIMGSRKERNQKREQVKKKKDKKDKQILPKNLARYARVAELSPFYIRIINANKQFLRKLKVDPITNDESTIFRSPRSNIDTENADYEYATNLMRLALQYNDDQNRNKLSELIIAAERGFFLGDGFSREVKNKLQQPVNDVLRSEANLIQNNVSDDDVKSQKDNIEIESQGKKSLKTNSANSDIESDFQESMDKILNAHHNSSQTSIKGSITTKNTNGNNS